MVFIILSWIDWGASCVFCMRVCWCVFLEETTNKTMFIVVGFVCLLFGLWESWYFTVLLACYYYLGDKLVAATSLPIAYVVPAAPVAPTPSFRQLPTRSIGEQMSMLLVPGSLCAHTNMQVTCRTPQ
jgi:hypothetical protein